MAAWRDLVIWGVALLAITLLAWLFLVRMAAAAPAVHAGMPMPATVPWQPVDALLAFSMWAVMMVAMMTPSAAPMVVGFAGLERMRRSGRTPLARTVVFVAGYLTVWSAFAAAAALAQWALGSADVMSPMLQLRSPRTAGVALLAIGAWQAAPMKDACLKVCRTPSVFLMYAWRDGMRGALAMGARHGFYCLGCCWALMLALFVVGVMNLAWVAALAMLVLLEKVLPAGRTLARVAGLGFAAAGLWLVLSV